MFFIKLRRIKAVTNTHRELPPVTMGHSVDEFFVALEQDSAQGKVLPNWWVTTCFMHLQCLWKVTFDFRCGELYLEVSLYLSLTPFFSLYLFYSYTAEYIRLMVSSRRAIDILKFSFVIWRYVKLRVTTFHCNSFVNCEATCDLGFSLQVPPQRLCVPERKD